MTTKVKESRIERTAHLTTGTSTAYVATATEVDASIDFEITIEPHLNCIAWPVTLNVNGAGAITIKWPDGNDLEANDLVANVPVKLFFDASQSLFFFVSAKNVTTSTTGEAAIIAGATNTAYSWAGGVSGNTTTHTTLDSITSNKTWTFRFGISWWNTSKTFSIWKNWVMQWAESTIWVSRDVAVVPWDVIDFVYRSTFSDWFFPLTWSTTFNFDYTPFFS